MELTRQELIVALKDAYDGMKSENMPCPWCSGRLATGDLDEHDQFCIVPRLQKAFEEVE